MEFLSRVKNSTNNIFSVTQSNLGKTKFDQEDYTNILSHFSSLRDRISTYISKYQNKMNDDDRQIIDQLNECKKKIPMITVWGAQSSGKSAMLNKIFPELKLNLRSCNGLGTRCPIEIHAGPSYQSKIYVRCSRMNEPHYFENLRAAEEYIEKELSKGNTDDICYDAKIILETKHAINICIVDLPGVTNDKNSKSKEFFETHKKEYLMKSDTIILHVVNGTIDPKTDVSASYLENINNEIIKVLTHTDLWAIDNTRSEYLYKCYDPDPKKYSIAIVNNRENETEILNSITLGNITKELIVGSNKLTEIISLKHQQKIFDFMQDFLCYIRQAQDLINAKLNVIGREKPDMQKYAIEFRTFMSNEIKKEFNNGSNLAIELSKIKSNITPEKFHECFKLVPDPTVISKNLEQGNLKQIEGTEGWNDEVQKYIAQLIDDIKKNIIIEHINKFCEILKRNADNVLLKEFNPFTTSASKRIILNMADYYNERKKKLEESIIEMLNNIAIQAYNNCDKNYVKQYLVSLHEDPVRLCFAQISNCSDSDIVRIVKSVKNNDGNEIRRLLETVLKNDLDNIYLAKGKQARPQLKYLWESKSIQINSDIMDILNSYRRTFEEKIIEEIQKINDSDLKEPEDIYTQRNSLLGIYKISDEIVLIIKKYI